MAIIRKSLNEIMASKPKINHAIYDATTETMIANQRKIEGYDVDLAGRWKRVDNKVKNLVVAR
jgi:hypothetical protein